MRNRVPALVLLSLVGAACGDDGAPAPQLEIVGHDPLLSRGMNAAPAIVGDTMYIGSRTEGGTHDDAGVLIVDISDPANPNVVGQIGPPDEGLLGMTSRELRAVPDKNLLIVLNFACSTEIHACTRDTNQFGARGTPEPNNIKLYDVSDPRAPALISRVDIGVVNFLRSIVPHEFYLWRDPTDADRILLLFSSPISAPSFRVLDISDPADVQTVVTWDPFEAGIVDEPAGENAILHSVSTTDDGGLAFLSMTGAGLSIIDTGEIADGVINPAIRPLTQPDTRIDYSPPHHPGTHSAVPVPGRSLVVVTDEVYGVPIAEGCPWGWARLVDYANPSRPSIVSEMKAPQNEVDCPASNGPELTSFTAHNSTVTANLALITWHSAGLRAWDIEDAANSVEVAKLKPEPLDSVAVEDPALGGDPLLMWSYPIIKDGLIYVVDIRNGLYVVRYTGPHEEEIAGTVFSEGNSNL
jgi:hypothetical protein